MKKRAKGIGLLSGGLDSILAVKVLQEQDLDLLGIIFSTPFFGPRPGSMTCRMTGIPLRVVDIAEKHLEMLRKPLYGYGSQLNPCIDCHALMLREAGGIMEREGADFLFTGEVLGQRPMSQRRDSLRSVEKLSGHAGRVLRPLSARLLAPTIGEEKKSVDRSLLLDISGRSRKHQMALVKRYGITDYPQPGGGCVLTKEGFVKKLRELLLRYPDATPLDMELLKRGRHFKLPQGGLCVVGRHQKDNERIEASVRSEDILLRVEDYPGPTGLILSGNSGPEGISLVARILVSYCDAPGGPLIRVRWRQGTSEGLASVRKEGKEQFVELML